jgi:hypothetical protein
MNAMNRTEPADEIRAFLPGIGADEYQLRAKLRSLCNAASAMIGTAEGDTTRQLARLTTEWTIENVYAPAEHGWLADVGKLCTRLMLTAMQAERLHSGVWIPK